MVCQGATIMSDGRIIVQERMEDLAISIIIDGHGLVSLIVYELRWKK
jgi:hypothetical protein